MRIGLVGPCDQELALLREAAEFLLGDCEAEQVVYLGNDNAAERLVEQWASEIMGGPPGEDAFLERAALLARTGEASEIDALLARDDAAHRLSDLRQLPPPPARAVEALEDRLVLFIHDKASLDEEDIANTSLIIYGSASKQRLDRFGSRAFFCPGPLRSGAVALLDVEDDGKLVLACFDPSTGAPREREVLQTRGPRLVVQT